MVDEEERIRENSIHRMRYWLEYHPPTTEECDIMLSGIRLCRFVGDWECSKCNFDDTDHTLGWIFPTKVCVKDAYAHGYKKEWNNLEEVDTMDPEEGVQVTPEIQPKQVIVVVEAIPEAGAQITVSRPVVEPAAAAAAPAVDKPADPAAPVEIKSIADVPKEKPKEPEYKLVIRYKDGESMVGVLEMGRDPILTTVKGTIQDAIAALPQAFADALEKLKANFSYPKKAEPVRPAITPSAPRPAVTPKPASTKPTLQNSIFDL